MQWVSVHEVVPAFMDSSVIIGPYTAKPIVHNLNRNYDDIISYTLWPDHFIANSWLPQTMVCLQKLIILHQLTVSCEIHNY
jgi:hypothetical protein